MCQAGRLEFFLINNLVITDTVVEFFEIEFVMSLLIIHKIK